MKMLKNKLKNSEGAALILVIFVMLMITAGIGLVSTQVNNQIISNKNTSEQVELKYIAEAGVEKTIADVSNGLEQQLSNLVYTPPGDTGGTAEDNAAFKYINIAADNLRLGADQINGSDNSNLKGDIVEVYDKITGNNGTLSKATPTSKLITNKEILKTDVSARITEVENIIATANNKNRLDASDEYLFKSMHYLKLSLYTLNRIGTCNVNLTGNYVAGLASNIGNDIISAPIQQCINDLGKVISNLDSIRQQGIIDYTEKSQLETQIRGYEQNTRDIESRIRNDVEQRLRNLENALKNNPKDVENKLNEAIKGIESTILEEKIINGRTNKGILDLQLQLYKLKEDTFRSKREDRNSYVQAFEKSIGDAINDLENVEIKLVELKCKLGRPNSTGETNQVPNPNPTPNLPSKIQIDIPEVTINLDDKNSYKRDGFTKEIPIQWQLDGNGGYEIKDISNIEQDIIVEGFIDENLNNAYKIKANITFNIQKGADGKYNVTYTVNSWDKI